MGLFGKKIKCSYCNKAVKESYAIDVGICPHCSKRLILDTSISNFDTCNHSDGSSHAGYNYESNSNIEQPTHKTEYIIENVTEHTVENRVENTENTVEIRNKIKPERRTNYQKTGKRPNIDSDFIRQVNEESNSNHNQGVLPTHFERRHFSGSRSSAIPRSTGKRINTSAKHSKIVFICFSIFIIIQVVIPILTGVVSIFKFSASYESRGNEFDDNTTNYGNEDYYDDDSYDDYDNEDTNSFPSSQAMQIYLPLYFEKDLSEITYEDLEYIKGISVTYNEKKELLYLYAYNADSKSYTQFIYNNYLDVETIMNQHNVTKCTIGVESDLLLLCISEILDDMGCFPNLEYIYIDQELPSNYSLSNCNNLSAFIAPKAVLETNIFAHSDDIMYLSVYEISNPETAEQFNNLKGFAHQNKYYMQKSLDVLKANNPDMFELTHKDVSANY